MWEPILAAAREQAERSQPAVRAAALLHIARVLAPSDGATAELLLERGIGLAKELSGKDREMILGEAPYLAAAVSPRLAITLYASAARRNHSFDGATVRLVNIMATHGHAADAVAYLNDPLPGDRFPLHFVNNIARECNDDTRRDLLRAAIKAWKDPAHGDFGHGGFGRDAFAGFFARSWDLLPREEAFAVLEDIVKWIGEVRSAQSHRRPITGRAGDPEFTSENQHLLFQILPALRRIDPGQIDILCEKNPEFAAAAKRFPMGYESLREEQSGSAVCEDSMMIGKSSGSQYDPPNCRIVPMTEALANDFEEAFREAFHRYEYDNDPDDPSEAPKECRASTNEFRNILFKAGQHQGATAAKHLDRIPDPDLRLFAQIELCAAMAGLPQIGHTSAYHVPKRRRPEVTDVLFDALPEEIRGWLKAQGLPKTEGMTFAIDEPTLKMLEREAARHKKDLPGNQD